jgi:hypothetical protein
MWISSYEQRQQETIVPKKQARLSAEARIPSSIKEIDETLGGFQAGALTWIYGSSPTVRRLPYLLCVNTYETFHGDTVFIDGGCTMNPYRIAQYARQKEQDVRRVLEHIHVSRAFTVYQLSTLIMENLEQAVQKYQPQTVIINAFPLLYADPDVPSEEASTLLKLHLKELKRITRTYHLATVLFFSGSTFQQRRVNICDLVGYHADESLAMHLMKQCTRIEFLTQGKTATMTSQVYGQLSLQDFGMVI